MYIRTSSKVFLFSVGIVAHQNYQIHARVWCTFIVLSLCILICGEVVAYHVSTETVYKLEIVYQALCYVYILSTVIISQRHVHLLKTLCRKLNGQWNFFSNQKVLFDVEKLFVTILKISILIYTVTLTTYISIPLVNFAIKGNYNDPLSYLLPFWYSTFEIDSVYKYAFMLALQTVLGCTTFFLYACSISFIICSLITCGMHIEEFKHLANEITSIETNDQLIPTSNYETEQKLITIIRYQQELHAFVRDLTSYFSKIFSVAMSWFMIVAILVLFMSTSSASTLVFRIKLSAVIINVMVSCFFFCYTAEYLSGANEQLNKGLYDVNWYNLSTKNRKIIAIAMAHNQREIQLRALGMYTMNLKLYASALRIIYSILNIMLKIRI